jgi:hypothetical protein
MDHGIHLEFAPSAARHRIGQDRIRYVIEHCPAPLYAPDDDPDRKDQVVFLGSDSAGVPLEIVAIEALDGSLLVIHAMHLRRRSREDYWRVTGLRP